MSSLNLIVVLGYLLVAAGLYGFYIGEIVLAALLFSFGGFLAKKLFISIRSTGVITMVTAIAYGFHHEYTELVLCIIFVGFVLACFNSKRSSSRDGGGDGSGGEWGIDFDFSSGSGSDSGGWGGGDGGGGGD